MKCLYACGRSNRRTTDHTASTGAAIACTTAEQHCPTPAACSWCLATSAGTATHDAACPAAPAAFNTPPPPQPPIRLCCGGDGRGAVYGIIPPRSYLTQVSWFLYFFHT
ncbi:Os05g0473101, partial [Oryza sativa Japonica Group]